MYYVLLFAHSWTRWLVLISAVVSLMILIKGLLLPSLREQARSKLERIAQGSFMGLLDLQICLGLTLLFLSPLVTFSAVHPWIYRHVGGMILAATVLHGGNTFAKKSSTPRAMRWTLLGANIVGLLFIFSSIPWPETSFARPLFRF